MSWGKRIFQNIIYNFLTVCFYIFVCAIFKFVIYMSFLWFSLFVGVRLVYLSLRSTATFVISFCRSLLLAFSSSSAFLRSLFTQSSHLSCGLPRFLQPCCFFVSDLFSNLSSFILTMCPAHSPSLHSPYSGYSPYPIVLTQKIAVYSFNHKILPSFLGQLLVKKQS